MSALLPRSGPGSPRARTCTPRAWSPSAGTRAAWSGWPASIRRRSGTEAWTGPSSGGGSAANRPSPPGASEGILSVSSCRATNCGRAGSTTWGNHGLSACGIRAIRASWRAWAWGSSDRGTRRRTGGASPPISPSSWPRPAWASSRAGPWG